MGCIMEDQQLQVFMSKMTQVGISACSDSLRIMGGCGIKVCLIPEAQACLGNTGNSPQKKRNRQQDPRPHRETLTLSIYAGK